ncbi:uncharacterized protein LOC106651473 [Trichogramma pretiosum]|uniref:Uncharacterized protein n=1 Tax=Trichogramma kaykai TaxID=54128 RepID=A0ABD2WHT2_9HYME|nr:uncharacterized protein LOC106651473 [Trichogramma pretiosum]
MIEYPKASNAVVLGGSITYVAGLLLLVSFTSPYWIQSYEETFNNFKHMGLWEYCFENFRYPYYQFDKLFNNCHHIFSQEYFVLREWLLPGWLMVVQAMVTISLILSFSGQVILVLILIRFPLKMVLENEWFLSTIVASCNSITSILLFLSVTVFGAQCWRRDFLMYPNFNYLSWSYGLAVISMMLHGIGAIFLFLDAKSNYKRRKESHNLVMQMQPNPQTNYSLQRTNYI